MERKKHNCVGINFAKGVLEAHNICPQITDLRVGLQKYPYYFGSVRKQESGHLLCIMIAWTKEWEN
uniref:Uncharacterized protein n=1 Tax=Solanum tuberosum TaxID=4113 RepID=M1CS95_SOLTU